MQILLITEEILQPYTFLFGSLDIINVDRFP